MKRIIGTVALITGLLGTGATIAAEQTVTLAVSNMTCASCPYIVQRSLTALPGVTKVAVSFEMKSAVVTFDDQKTTVDALIAIATKTGYPSKLAAAPAPKIR